MKRDLSYLKDCPIAVLGAGAVGMTLAADCKLRHLYILLR